MKYQITKGQLRKAKKVVIYGPEGVGKTSLAAGFPKPVFIDTEGSTNTLDVSRLPKPSSWEMLLDECKNSILYPECTTLIIDTIDWAEQLCINAVCSRHNKSGIEDFGYGNGYVYEKEEFGKLLNTLDEVIDAGINVVLVAHAQLRKMELPEEAGAFDRWELKLGKKTGSHISPLVKEWADMVLFANYETYVIATDDKGKKHKAQGSKRVMYTQHHACWDAKNREGLPEKLDLDIKHIIHCIPQERVLSDNNPAMREVISAMEKICNEEETKPESNFETIIDDDNIPFQDPAAEPPNGIPKALYDLMLADGIKEEEIQAAVSEKGYYPKDMEICKYDTQFINGVLIGAWQQVKALVMSSRDTLSF